MIRNKLLSYYNPENLWFRASMVTMMVVLSFKHETMSPILWYSGIDAILRLYTFNYHEEVELYMLPWWAIAFAMLWVGSSSEGGRHYATYANPAPVPMPTPEPKVQFVDRVVERVVEKPVQFVKKTEMRQYKAGFGIGNCATCANWFGPREQQMGTDMIFADPRALGRCSVFKNRRMASTTCDSYTSAL